MIKFENWEVAGVEAALRGMRNPMNSWDQSDSDSYYIGPEDRRVATNLTLAGTDHRKFLRMMVIWVDITAPLYWWKQFDTYRVGVEKNSCSTMHKIHSEELTGDDFSYEHLLDREDTPLGLYSPEHILDITIGTLNGFRKRYLETKDKKYWWQLIQLLPDSYNQKRTVMMSYEAARNMYQARKGHKLDEWSGPNGICNFFEGLPHSEFITMVKAVGEPKIYTKEEATEMLNKQREHYEKLLGMAEVVDEESKVYIKTDMKECEDHFKKIMNKAYGKSSNMLYADEFIKGMIEVYADIITCPDCNGEGLIDEHQSAGRTNRSKCSKCNGRGRIEKEGTDV